MPVQTAQSNVGDVLLRPKVTRKCANGVLEAASLTGHCTSTQEDKHVCGRSPLGKLKQADGEPRARASLIWAFVFPGKRGHVGSECVAAAGLC